MTEKDRRETVLRVENIGLSFGGLAALKDIDLEVLEGDVHGIIGPNGSGKTTFFNVVSGIYRQDNGHIYLKNRLMDDVEPYQRAKMGINRSFQHQRTFSGMTVLENVLMGQHKSLAYGVWDTVFKHRKAKEQEEKAIARSLESLDFVGLRRYANRNIADLAYVEQRLVEIARALATDHVIMLLDEPAAGLSPTTVTELDAVLLKIRNERHISILVVEHVLPLVFKISDRISVFNEGRKIAEGTPDEIRSNQIVTEAYVGKDGQLDNISRPF